MKNLTPERMRCAIGASCPSGRRGFYIASRTHHAEKWRNLKAFGAPIISRWHSLVEEDGTDHALSDLGRLWCDINEDITQAAGLLLYVEPDDFPLRGAFVEVGMALTQGIPIAIFAPGVSFDSHGRPLGSWIHHPLVSMHDTFEAARSALSSEG